MKIPINEIYFEFLSERSNISSFRCSNPELDDFISADALYYQQERLASTRLAYHHEVLVGFFTLVNDSIFADAITDGDGDVRFEEDTLQ